MRRALVSSAAVLITLLLLAACGTTRQPILAPVQPTATVQKDGLSLTLRYLDDKMLKEDFGSSANPFLTEYYRLTFRRILVFELTLRNGSGGPLAFQLSDCTLDYGGKERSPENRFQLGQYWETLDDDPRVYKRKEQVIERYVLPNRATVAPGGTLFGYLVFMGNLPRQGEATVSVPVGRDGATTELRAAYTF